MSSVETSPAKIGLNDSESQYGLVSRINHWLGAVVIIAIMAIGLYFEDMPDSDEKIYWIKLHISLAVLAGLFILFRVFWRVKSNSPAALEQPALVKKITTFVHFVLLLALAVLVVSGPVLVFSAGYPIEIFDWITIASPMTENKALHDVVEIAHKLSSKILLVGVILHVLAMIKHLIFEREALMGRMLGR